MILGIGWAVIQKNLDKMVIVEYPNAGVPCQFLSFFSPGNGRRVRKHCDAAVMRELGVGRAAACSAMPAESADRLNVNTQIKRDSPNDS